MAKKYNHIVWDWNGTLLDDVDFCREVTNSMLAERDLPLLKNTADYHRVFCFPVIRYYRNLGYDFEKESFESLAEIYMSRYHSDRYDCKLFGAAEGVLKKVNASGIKQVVISASKQEHLDQQLKPFSIRPLLDGVYGIADHFAASKEQLVKNWVDENHIDTTSLLFVGDSAHDYEVTKAVGADCVLIPNGHQSRATLEATGAPVVDDISKIPPYLGIE